MRMLVKDFSEAIEQAGKRSGRIEILIKDSFTKNHHTEVVVVNKKIIDVSTVRNEYSCI